MSSTKQPNKLVHTSSAQPLNVSLTHFLSAARVKTGGNESPIYSDIPRLAVYQQFILSSPHHLLLLSNVIALPACLLRQLTFHIIRWLCPSINFNNCTHSDQHVSTCNAPRISTRPCQFNANLVSCPWFTLLISTIRIINRKSSTLLEFSRFFLFFFASNCVSWS